MHPSIKNILQSSVFILLALAIWEYGSLSGWWRPFLFPAPSAISGYLEEAIRDNSLWAATVVTIRRLLLGYLAGISIGIPAGLLSARFQLMRNTIGVLALGFQGLPSVCWVPLAILWFGQEEAAILFVVVMGTVWSVILATEKWTCQRPSDLCPRSTDNGSRLCLHAALCHASGFCSIHRQRYEAGLGLFLALPDVRRNFCSHPDRTGIGTAPALRKRTQFHGAGHGHHVRYYSHRPALRQTHLLPPGTSHLQTLGD